MPEDHLGQELRVATMAFREIARIGGNAPTWGAYLDSLIIEALASLRTTIATDVTFDQASTAACAKAVESCCAIFNQPRKHIAGLLRRVTDDPAARAVLILALKACERAYATRLSASVYDGVETALASIADAASDKMAAAA